MSILEGVGGQGTLLVVGIGSETLPTRLVDRRDSARQRSAAPFGANTVGATGPSIVDGTTTNNKRNGSSGWAATNRRVCLLSTSELSRDRTRVGSPPGRDASQDAAPPCRWLLTVI